MVLTADEIRNFDARGARVCRSLASPYYSCYFEFIGPNDELSDAAFPKYVYRYLDHEQYADDLVTRGTLKLGSLLKYRDREAYGDTRHDEKEGQAGFLSKLDGGLFNGFPYQYSAISQDCWVLCTSLSCSNEVAKRFQSDFCVRITLRPFAIALAGAMAQRSDVGGAGIVRYSVYAGGENVVSSSRAKLLFARMHKRSTYLAEKELRIWFESRAHRDTNREVELRGRNPSGKPTNVEPFLLTCSDLSRFCKRVSIH